MTRGPASGGPLEIETDAILGKKCDNHLDSTVGNNS